MSSAEHDQVGILAAPSSGGPSRVQSVERAALLLRAVAAARFPANSATALAEVCGLNRTTTWRILNTLEEQALVCLDRPTGGFSIGPGILDLAGHSESAELTRRARPVLERIALESGETAALALLRGTALVYVDEVAPPAVVAAAWQGRRVPIHATSTGKALLASSESGELHGLLELDADDRLPRHTDTTITTLNALLVELETTRSRGFGICRGEFEAAAWGVSAPILGAGNTPLAVLSIWGPAGRLTEARFTALGAMVRSGADEIAHR